MAKRAHILLTGDVDGTDYRFFLQQKAQELGLKGFIHKIAAGHMEAIIEGKINSVDEYIRFINKGVTFQATSNEFTVEIFDTLLGYTTLKAELV